MDKKMEIESCDLMIGDWVKDEEGHFCRVKALSEDSVMVNCRNGWRPCRGLRGVELTDGLRRRMGGELFAIFDGVTGWRPTWVHELQHLLRALGRRDTVVPW